MPQANTIRWEGPFLYRILIVEDDQSLARSIARVLADRGFDPAVAEDLTDILPRFRAFDPQLVILDLSLPYHNGYHWCRRLREVSDLPILFLSSAADSLNQVTAMDLGADDYIAKPFDAELLGARVQALLRRAYAYRRAPELADCGGVPLDLGAGVLRADTGPVTLTRNELRILQALLERRGKVVRREDLMTALWATDCYIDENTLTVNVARLRKRLEAAGVPGLIRTVKGEGYCIP